MKVLVLLIFTFIIAGCTSTKYVEVPVDRVKIEYRNTESVDTIVKYDSIFVKDAGDTVYVYKYKYLYKVQERIDTIYTTDTITTVKVVETESNKVNGKCNYIHFLVTPLVLLLSVIGLKKIKNI